MTPPSSGPRLGRKTIRPNNSKNKGNTKNKRDNVEQPPVKRLLAQLGHIMLFTCTQCSSGLAEAHECRLCDLSANRGKQEATGRTEAVHEWSNYINVQLHRSRN